MQGWPRRRGRAAGRAVRQDGPGGRSPSAPAKPGRLRPVARLMLKCAEGQGIVTGKEIRCRGGSQAGKGVV